MDARQELKEEHNHIEGLLTDMKLAVAADDPRALCAAWGPFERELIDHMGFEERELLPGFAEIHPNEARALYEEHAELRRLLGDLGVRVDLHTLRLNVADELLERLRAHARLEDQLLYPWAAQHLPAGTKPLERTARERVRVELRRPVDEARVKLHLFGMDASAALAEARNEAKKLKGSAIQASQIGYERLVKRLLAITESVVFPRAERPGRWKVAGRRGPVGVGR